MQSRVFRDSFQNPEQNSVSMFSFARFVPTKARCLATLSASLLATVPSENTAIFGTYDDYFDAYTNVPPLQSKIVQLIHKRQKYIPPNKDQTFLEIGCGKAEYMAHTI